MEVPVNGTLERQCQRCSLQEANRPVEDGGSGETTETRENTAVRSFGRAARELGEALEASV